MVRIAHISDTHLGNRQYGSDVRRQDFTNAFAASVEQAIEHDADAIIHTGDLFHRRTPPLPQVNQCIDVLRRADDAGVPFLGIVGNHDRKMDDQWLDLISHTGTAERLDSSPTMIGDGDEAIAIYGIDAVPSPAWESTGFELEEPENDDAYRLLCMHQLLHPPVPEIMAEYPTESVIERVNIDIDGLALGDYHESVSETVAGVDVWYAGSTERGSAGEEGPRSISLLSEFRNHSMTREEIPLETREFQRIEINFADDDGYGHARSQIENHDITDAAAIITLSGKRTSLTANDVHEIALDRGAAVARVDDNRGREHIDIGNSPNTEVEDPDTLIDQRLADAGLSDPALAVESLVRDEETSTNGLSDTAEKRISEAQDAAFAGEEPPEAVLGDGPTENDATESGTTQSDDTDESEDEAVTDSDPESESEPEPEATDTTATTETEDTKSEPTTTSGASIDGGATTSQASFEELTAETEPTADETPDDTEERN